jgi:taurine dioxygenase
MKAFLDPLTAQHDANPVYRAIFPDVLRIYPIATHPVIRTHPVTGRKGIFVNASKTTRINEVSKSESDALLAMLFAHVQNPNFQVRFRWSEGALAFWDNRCTQHFAVWDYFPDVRSGLRVTIAGDAPF